jgi:hypothetical protein
VIEVINRGERWLVCADGEELSGFDSREEAVKAAGDDVPVVIERRAEVVIKKESQNGNRL